MIRLSKEKKELVESFERGEWKSVKNQVQAKKVYQQYAKYTFQKDKRINIRISEKDLTGIQKKAVEDGGTVMEWKAKWVWVEGEESPRNFWLAARKVIDIRNSLKEAKLHISADSRYVLWLNGKRLGQGPIRSWPWNLSYDTYDIKGALRPGKNVISVLVLHWGVSNFQYIECRGGLLAQLDIVTAKGKKISIGTDRTWKGISHPSFNRRTMRISCQQGWVEEYMAEKEPEGWNGGWNGKAGKRESSFSGKTWKNLKEIGKVGILPWKKLSPRDIPFLTEEPVYPVSILRQRVVKPLNQHFAFDLKPNLIPMDRTANPASLSGFAVTILHSPEDIRGKIFFPDTGNVSGKIRVNGKDCPWIGENSFDNVGMFAECFFKKGDNLIIWDVRGTYHNWHLLFSIDIPFKANLRAPFSKAGKSGLATFCPVDAKEKETFNNIWNAKNEEEMRPYRSVLKFVSTADEVPANIFAETTQVKEKE